MTTVKTPLTRTEKIWIARIVFTEVTSVLAIIICVITLVTA